MLVDCRKNSPPDNHKKEKGTENISIYIKPASRIGLTVFLFAVSTKNLDVIKFHGP